MLRLTSSPPLFFVLLTLLGCESPTDVHAEGRSGQTAEEPQRQVQLVSVEARPFEDVVELSGTLAADEQAILSTKVAGRLATLVVDLASPVEAGQVLARVEATDYEFGVQQARAALGQARAQVGLEPNASSSNLNVETVAAVRQAQATLRETQVNASRLGTLAEEGLAPQSELDAAQASLLRAEAGLEAAREQVHLLQAQIRQRQSEVAIAQQRLADTQIRSPITGFVLARRASVGEYLAAGAPVVEVVKIDPLRLRLAVPERDAARIQVGQRVRVKSSAVTQEPEGSVARVAPSLEADTRSLLIEADIKNPGQLRPGNFVSARILLGSRTVPSVPADAVVTFAGLQKVLLVVGDKIVERVVTIGERAGDHLEITSGLNVGEAVVKTPGSLQQGQMVQVTTPGIVPEKGP